MKRKMNITSLKVKFLGATNLKGSRLSITQTNINKKIIIEQSKNLEAIDFFCSILEKIAFIKSYSLIVDNTQMNFYTFAVECESTYFPDFIIEIQSILNR